MLRALLVSVAILSASPLTPPGAIQPIIPPAPTVTPTPAPIPFVDPQPESDEPTLAIVATVDEVQIDEPVVSLPIGAMLRLTLTGGVVANETPPAVSWSLNQPTKRFYSPSQLRGHDVGFCDSQPGVWLFTASINHPAPQEAAIVAQRWVVVGKSPEPEPTPNPVDPQPAPDGTATVKLPGFRAVLLYESAAGVPDLFASNVVRDYLDAKAMKGEDGKTPDYRCWDDDLDPSGDFDSMVAYRKAAKTDKLPAIHVGNGTNAYNGPCFTGDRPWTDDELLSILKRYGG